ncbi:hypothetical protein GGR57DRAFT_303635 [Xylariaceae sp. FL1272]|nr:hypothetical protein GGR57DRAFT_303635 [Xylariaceae sp. FL1272]
MSDPPANPSSSSTASANTTQVHLKATYTSPTASQTFTSPALSLPLPQSTSSTSIQQKQAYLSALRSQTTALQERINEELTRQMEIDNQRGIEDGVNGKKRKVDEAAEEENYGEEVVDEDE